ncbi:MAG: hypothetical protein QM723_07970 [Myxococcaceae bacterium]
MRGLALLLAVALLSACDGDPVCPKSGCGFDASMGGGGGHGGHGGGDAGSDAGDGFDASVPPYDGGGPMGVSDGGPTTLAGPLAFTPATTAASHFFHGPQGEGLAITITNEPATCFVTIDAGLIDEYQVLTLNFYDPAALTLGDYPIGTDAGHSAGALYVHGLHGTALPDGGGTMSTYYDFDTGTSGSASLDFIDRRDGTTYAVRASGHFDAGLSLLDGGSAQVWGTFAIDCGG